MTHTMLILGAAGMLGRAWTALLDAQATPHRGITHADCDLTHPNADDALRQIIHSDHITTVINCTAFTDVDGAEQRETDATRLNGDAVAMLAEVCRDAGATLVHYSTDYVFDGHGTRPYRVDEPRCPINAYGRSKAAGEQAIERTPGLDYRLIRTSWLYAPWGKNFVLTMAKLTKEREQVRVVNDQRGRPTSAEHLARISLKLLHAGQSGTYHVTDGGECTWYDLSHFIGQRINPACRVEPCRSDEFPRPAVRPAYSVLDLSKTESLAGPMEDWHTHVENMLGKI